MIFHHNTVMSAYEAASWTPEQWKDKGRDGVLLQRRCLSLTGNTVRFVKFGMTFGGDKILVSNNNIDFFGNDGMRLAEGDNVVIQRNIVKNHYGKLTNENHNDGIQGWDLNDTPSVNLVIDSNAVIETTGEYDEIPPRRQQFTPQDYMQAIGFFDGVWKNVQVTNNLVIVSAYHGIAMMGVENGVIANNTSLSSLSPTANFGGGRNIAWIYGSASKKGLGGKG